MKKIDTKDEDYEALTKAENKRIKIDIAIFFVLLILIASTVVGYFQMKSEAGQCTKAPYKYASQQLEKVGYKFNNNVYFITKDGLKQAIVQDNGPADVNISQLSNLIGRFANER